LCERDNNSVPDRDLFKTNGQLVQHKQGATQQERGLNPWKFAAHNKRSPDGDQA